jgi:hypothetical protein
MIDLTYVYIKLGVALVLSCAVVFSLFLKYGTKDKQKIIK